MNNIEVEVISKEIIKPSSPTPDHLRHYQFSFLDQLAPSSYNPLLLFYEFNAKTMPNNITEISSHLKNSLSEVITLFYPLAGRLHKHKSFVDCNDEGIPYFEAQVKNCRLSDVLNNPNPNELNKLLPFELDDLANTFPLGVQLNIFQCGGFAIGQCISHRIADGLSYFIFSKTWAAIARGDQANIQPPQFVSATLFPPVDQFDDIGFDAGTGITKDRVTKRFVFHASEIERLRAKYEQNIPLKGRPTRIETLSAFIWWRFVAATRASGTTNKLCRVVHAVDLRQRCEPPLPQRCFGNLFRVAVTAPLRISSGGDEECDDHGSMMIKEIREKISKIDNEYVKMLQVKGEEYLGFMKQNADNFKKEETTAVLAFSSHCRFPRYDNDFGWGKPTWVGSPALTYKNLVLFMDTKEGDGIEAYVSLEEQVMAKFQSDDQLLASVSTTSTTGRVLN